MERREFLKKTLPYLISGTAALALAYPVSVFTTFRKARSRDVLFDEKDLGGEISYKDGVFVIRKGDDIAAVSARCAHLGCLVNYNPMAQRFECPCHGSIYDKEGKRISGPTNGDLKRLSHKRLPEGGISVSVETY